MQGEEAARVELPGRAAPERPTRQSRESAHPFEGLDLSRAQARCPLEAAVATHPQAQEKSVQQLISRCCRHRRRLVAPRVRVGATAARAAMFALSHSLLQRQSLQAENPTPRQPQRRLLVPIQPAPMLGILSQAQPRSGREAARCRLQAQAPRAPALVLEANRQRQKQQMLQAAIGYAMLRHKHDQYACRKAPGARAVANPSGQSKFNKVLHADRCPSVSQTTKQHVSECLETLQSGARFSDASI